MDEFKPKHFAAIFGIAILAILLAPRVVPTLKGLPVVGPILSAL